VDHCLSLSFFLLAIALSILNQFTTSDLFDIFKIFLNLTPPEYQEMRHQREKRQKMKKTFNSFVQTEKYAKTI
jgi:hypothetical protein